MGFAYYSFASFSIIGYQSLCRDASSLIGAGDGEERDLSNALDLSWGRGNGSCCIVRISDIQPQGFRSQQILKKALTLFLSLQERGKCREYEERENERSNE